MWCVVSPGEVDDVLDRVRPLLCRGDIRRRLPLMVNQRVTPWFRCVLSTHPITVKLYHGKLP